MDELIVALFTLLFVVLIWVVGVGYRWLVVQGHEVWPPVPPSPQPK